MMRNICAIESATRVVLANVGTDEGATGLLDIAMLLLNTSAMLG